MRICHFADNHLGAGTGRREDDLLDSFARTIDRIIELKPDLVVNAGDLFHMVRPPNRVIAFASEHLLKLGRDAGIPTVIISGNHDAPKQPQIGAVLSIFQKYDNLRVIYKSQYERIKFGDCSVSAVPHCLTPEILRLELEKIKPDRSARYNLLLAHGVVAGIQEFRMADLSEQEISSDYFRGFDYVALGHYHNYTCVQPGVYYCGSTERLSQAEAGYAKGFIEIDLAEQDLSRRVIFHEIATRVMVDLTPVSGSGRAVEEIVADLENRVRNEKPGDKIIRLRVTDIPEETYRALPFDRIARLKQEAFSLDIRFDKKPPPEQAAAADVGLGRLDTAFDKFLSSTAIEGLDREKLRDLALDFLRRAEENED